MISIIFWIIAAAANAFMDCVENENFFESILRHKQQSFWYKRESWKSARKIFGYKIDMWHLLKSFMILMLAAAIILYSPIINWWVDILIFGTAWNIAFVFVYHKILKVK